MEKRNCERIINLPALTGRRPPFLFPYLFHLTNVCSARQEILNWPEFAFLLDHYVTVLNVDDRYVTVGDPLNGRQTLTHAEFARKWRFVGVVLNRNG